MPVSLRRARRAKQEVTKRLAGAGGLVGIGITKIGDDYAVKVNFSTEPDVEMPPDVGGVPVLVAIVGKIRKHE